MSDAPPIRFQWKGDGFSPATPYQARLADKHFVIGETYTLIEHQERSQKSHSHYFARVHDAFLNLPEEYAERFPTEDHMRRYALIKAGFYNSTTLICATHADAVRTASFLRPIDEFSIVTVQECAVIRYTAKSQSARAMGNEDFQRSKDAVLEILSNLVGTTKKDLEGNSPA